MKALRFHAPEDVRLEDVPEPECKSDEIKIKVRNCSTCGTDVKILHNGHQNITGVTTMGHEVAGEIVEIGSEVAGDWKIGDRVQSIAAVPCGQCHECRKGWMQVCQNQTSVGYQYDGGFAEYMIVPPQVLKVDGLNRIPDDVDFDEAVQVAGAITPVPGGVGPMTIACLLRNTLVAACRQHGIDPPRL